jgi:uncharacterized protein YjaG (DUF416 family)
MSLTMEPEAFWRDEALRPIRSRFERLDNWNEVSLQRCLSELAQMFRRCCAVGTYR